MDIASLSVVIAATITLVANVLVTIINAYKQRAFELRQSKNEIITYRYTNLYELLKTDETLMNDRDEQDLDLSVDKEDYIHRRDNLVTESVMCVYNASNSLYQCAIPLLDREYRDELFALKEECSESLSEFLKVALKYGLGEENKKAFSVFAKKVDQYHNILVSSIINQMSDLMLL